MQPYKTKWGWLIWFGDSSYKIQDGGPDGFHTSTSEEKLSISAPSNRETGKQSSNTGIPSFQHQKWVIGTGAAVKALDDAQVPWMGRLRDRLLCSTNTIATSSITTIPDLQQLTVTVFITNNNHGQIWVVCLLHALWAEDIVRDIISIPLGPVTCCVGRRNRRGYAVSKHLTSIYYPGTSGQLAQTVVWKLDVPQKLKIFCWRLLLDRLPTRARLARLVSTVDPICPICAQEKGIINHIFSSCTFAQYVWALFPISTQTLHPNSDIAYWFWNLASPKLRNKRVVVFWYLWKTRNHYIFQYHPVNPFHVFSKATNALLEWNMSRLYIGTRSTQAVSPDWWLLPPPGWLKLNFDGSFHNTSGKPGIGGLIRDSLGKLIMAYTA